MARRLTRARSRAVLHAVRRLTIIGANPSYDRRADFLFRKLLLETFLLS